MATETIGKYQLHLIAYEMPGSGSWEPYLKIDKFDEAKQDMVRFISRERGEDWKHLVVNRLTPIPECECGCNDKKEQDND